MKIIFLGYRSWAINTINAVINHPAIERSHIFTEGNQLQNFLKCSDSNTKNKDWIIIAIGWSEILPIDVVKRFVCLGLHPSDLPKYKGGSPLQHQIIDGVTNSKMSLFRLTEKLDSGEIWGKSDLSLIGDNMTEIFDNLIVASRNLLLEFLSDYPNIKKYKQEPFIKTLKRRLPEESKLEFSDFEKSSLYKTYNKIRCLTDPYPNAYLEDDDGNRLVFKNVSFQTDSN